MGKHGGRQPVGSQWRWLYRERWLEVGCPCSVRLLPSAVHGPEGPETAQEVHLRPESRGLQARGISALLRSWKRSSKSARGILPARDDGATAAVVRPFSELLWIISATIHGKD